MTKAAANLRHRALPDLADVLGWEAVSALVRRFGGQRIYIPGAFAATHPIVATIGEEKAALLAAHYHMTEIYLSSALRREAVVRAAAARNPRPSINQIVEETGLSYDGVVKILKRRQSVGDSILPAPATGTPQLTLFDLLAGERPLP